MRIVLIADVFPPLRSSGAVQLRDLSREFARLGNDVTVMVASPELTVAWQLDRIDDIRILRLRTPKTKDRNYVQRTLGEFAMPFAMLRNLKVSPCANEAWDAVVWYSPTIFLGPLVKALKTRSRCPSYLIIRDIFPEWAVDMGLMGRGLPYQFFRSVARYQYSVADVIGVQTPGNLSYFAKGTSKGKPRLEVLHNWLADSSDIGCSIDIANGVFKGRKIFVYAGNMGIAQGMGILLDLAEHLKARTDIGFIFVGRGSDTQRLRETARLRGLDNVAFYDEIDPDEIPGLYKQCHVGLVALDPRHKTHNIPGKFLSYMQSSLPVLACINEGNDLVELIEETGVGRTCTDSKVSTLSRLAVELLIQIDDDKKIGERCKALAESMFSPATAVKKIISAVDYERKSIYAPDAKPSVFHGSGVAEDEAEPEYSQKL
jgi:glycosyltransferase involved in cell wall biosynthesis